MPQIVPPCQIWFCRIRLHVLKANQWISAFNGDYDALPVRVLILERLGYPMRGRETDQARIDEALPDAQAA